MNSRSECNKGLKGLPWVFGSLRLFRADHVDAPQKGPNATWVGEHMCNFLSKPLNVGPTFISNGLKRNPELQLESNLLPLRNFVPFLQLLVRQALHRMWSEEKGLFPVSIGKALVRSPRKNRIVMDFLRASDLLPTRKLARYPETGFCRITPG